MLTFTPLILCPFLLVHFSCKCLVHFRLALTITDSNEKICIYTGDRKAKNGVFVFTDMLDEESCWYNQDGTPSESADREIIDRCGGGYQYGFDIVAKNFDAFLNISYLENCEQ